MPHSSLVDYSGKALEYYNERCSCGEIAELQIGLTPQDAGELYYKCKSNTCSFFQWCNPVFGEPDPVVVENNEMRLFTYVQIKNEIDFQRKKAMKLEQDVWRMKIVLVIVTIVSVCFLAMILVKQK